MLNHKATGPVISADDEPRKWCRFGGRHDFLANKQIAKIQDSKRELARAKFARKMRQTEFAVARARRRRR
jgi:hypothetical protein